MSVIIAVMNGKPTCGKTTIQNECERLYDGDVTIKILSSVDVIYKVYKMLGWNGVKDDNFRKNMSILKQIYIENCDGPTRDIINEAIRSLYDDKYCDNTIIFYDCREKEEINKLKSIIDRLNIIGIYCKTVLVKRCDDIDQLMHGNDSDDGIIMDECFYDITVYNTDLENIPNIASDLVQKLLEVSKNV